MLSIFIHTFMVSPRFTTKIWYVSPSTRFFVPSNELGWIISGTLKGVKVVNSEKIDLIFVSCPPYTLAINGVILKMVTKKPLIIDFRDGWTLDPYITYLTSVHKIIDTFLHQKVMEKADRIICISNSMRKEFCITFPLCDKKVIVVPNGFDAIPLKHHNSIGKFTIAFIGSTYNCSQYRSPLIFFEALKNIIIAGKISEGDMNVIFFGDNSKELIEMIDNFKFNKFIKFSPRVSQNEATDCMLNSNLLLLIERSTALTTKAFEYLASGKPILAIISNGELAELIRDYSDNSYISTSENVDEIAEAKARDAYTKWINGELKLTVYEKLKRFREKFDRESLTGEVSKAFDSLLTEQKL